jgi:hypothetical protein
MLLLLLHRSDYCQAAAMPLLLVKGHSRRLTGAASCSCLTPSSAQLRCGKLNLDYSELSALTVGCAPAARLGKHPAALGTAAASYPADIKNRKARCMSTTAGLLLTEQKLQACNDALSNR